MVEQGIIIDDNIDVDTKLYRYMTLSKFISMVEKNETYITRVKDWEDEWEVPDLKNGPSSKDRNVGADLFGQSWSLEGVSDALWRIYSRDCEGILIQTTAGKFSLLRDINFGLLSPVFYYNDFSQAKLKLEETDGTKRTLTEGLLKRYAFKHEMEVRLIVINNEKCLGRVYNSTHINLRIDPIEFVEGIIVDPRASQWYVETINKYCFNKGFKTLPIKSDLFF